MLRNFKLAYSVYNFFHKKNLQHISKAYNKWGVKKKYFASVNHADFKDINAEIPWLDKENSSTVLPFNAGFQKLSKNMQDNLLSWSDKGYAILPSFFSSETIDQINAEIDQLIEKESVKFRYNHKKIMFAIDKSPYLKQIANDPLLNAILHLLLGRKVNVFQSINFLEGSEQKSHSDTIHMTTFPLGNLIAVWVALEDIDEECGPLHYYPGSHKLPYVLNENYNHGGNSWLIGDNAYKNYEKHIENLIKEQHFEKKIFTAKKGDILIWHANLLHGGEPILRKGSTRKSMVFHYFAEDVVCYHEITQRPALINNQ